MGLKSGLGQFDILKAQSQLTRGQLLRAFAELERPQIVVVLFQLVDQQVLAGDDRLEALDLLAQAETISTSSGAA